MYVCLDITAFDNKNISTWFDNIPRASLDITVFDNNVIVIVNLLFYLNNISQLSFSELTYLS